MSGYPYVNQVGDAPTKKALLRAFDASAAVATDLSAVRVDLDALTAQVAALTSPVTTTQTVISVTGSGGGGSLPSFNPGDTVVADATGTVVGLAAVAAGSYLRSNGVAVPPIWSTLTLPNAATLGDLLYASAANGIGALADVATGNALISGGVGAAPSYGKIGLTTHVSGTLAVGNGGSGAATFTAHGVLLGEGASAFGVTAVGATNTVLHGNTGADPTFSAVSLTADVTGLLPYANMVNATAASILVGRGSAAGGGVLQEITLGANLTMTGTVLSASGGGASHALLDGSVDSDTVAYTVVRGSMIVGNSTPKWGGLVIGSAGSVLNSNGTDPSWNTAVVIATSVSVPAILTASGALTVTPAAGSNLSIVLSTTGDFVVNSTALYLDTSQGGGAGWVGIGTATPAAPLDIVSSYASDNVVCGMAYYSVDDTGPIWRVKKSRGTPGSPTIVSSGDVVGRMAFLGYDGTGFLNTCFIDSEVDGTPSAAHMPGRLTFSTNNNAGGCTEVMRIDHVGRMFVGTTADILTSFVTLSYSAATYNGLVINDTSSTTSAIFARFAIGSTQIGNIQRNAATSAVLYNTTSDVRLKTDQGLATDLSVLKALRVHDFAWTADGTPDRGLFAQEAYAVTYRGVSVGTDERNAAGVLVQPWALEKATYVPDLIVGWQNHEKRLSDLEAAWQNRSH